MTGTWEAMVADEERTRTILNDYQRDLIRLEDAAWAAQGRDRYGISFQQGTRHGIRLAISWVLAKLTLGLDDLTLPEIITELRKGDTSLYWPLFVDDPKVWGLCDHCRTRQLFDARGICDHCGAETE